MEENEFLCKEYKKPHPCSHSAVRISLPDWKKMYFAVVFPKSNTVCHVNLVLPELLSGRHQQKMTLKEDLSCIIIITYANL